jgi:hypothetical protein
MTRVRIRSTGRVVVTDDDLARRWVAEGYAEVVETEAETASRTPTPQPATRKDIEHR